MKRMIDNPDDLKLTLLSFLKNDEFVDRCLKSILNSTQACASVDGYHFDNEQRFYDHRSYDQYRKMRQLVNCLLFFHSSYELMGLPETNDGTSPSESMMNILTAISAKGGHRSNSNEFADSEED